MIPANSWEYNKDTKAMGTALVTDLYELTMAQSYLEHDKTGTAVFSLFCRDLPRERNFLVACGLETLISQLSAFRFTHDDLSYLSGLGIFSPEFLAYLKNYRFTGTLYAVPEGSIVFENEPIVQIEGRLPDMQILETLVVNSIHFQTLAASKAARIIAVSRGRDVVDFGFRRAHMPEAGIHAARAAVIAGFSGTSNLEAGRRFNILVAGTMGHSYIMMYGDEEEAFRAYLSSFPDRGLLLIDTYDTLACAEKVKKLAQAGMPVTGVRIDSGDIEELVPAVRRVLDSAGLSHIRIFVTGNVDEYVMDTWLNAGLPIDTFGVGTHFVTSSDATYLDMVYKLVEYEKKPTIKTSPGKTSFPFRRQVVRHYRDDLMDFDEVVRMDTTAEQTGLVKTYMRNGELVQPLPSLADIKDKFRREMASLPSRFKSLSKEKYRVTVRQEL